MHHGSAFSPIPRKYINLEPVDIGTEYSRSNYVYLKKKSEIIEGRHSRAISVENYCIFLDYILIRGIVQDIFKSH